MEYYNNILCISGQELIINEQGGIITKSLYDKLSRDGYINVIRRGCYKTSALIEYDRLRSDIKKKIIEKYGDPRPKVESESFKDRIKPDHNALEYFSSYRLPGDKLLPAQSILEYCNNAAIFNTLKETLEHMRTKRLALGSRNVKFFQKAVIAINDIRIEYPNTLPNSERRLKEKYLQYIKEGYEALISKKFCNDNSRKVTATIEQLILSLYTMPNKPYTTSVRELYVKFLYGEINVYNEETGEIYNREDYYKDGKPIEISESTCWNYINSAINRAVVDSKRTGKLEFNSTHRPHHHRHSPEFSFSKISLDDRDLPRKLHDGTRVKVYYSYDVASGCVIGKAYSRDKDRALFLDCIRDMFRLINSNNYGLPLEIEVEHHLVNTFSDGLVKAGILFPFVRWCNPGNSQEKRAEHFNRIKKYGVEKQLQTGIGRFYAKIEANRIKVEYGQKDKTYSFEQLVADDIEAINVYNNDLHHDQKKYPGKTRWQVMNENINPSLAQVDKAVLYKYIGDKTNTSIRRNQYITVKHCKYQVDKLEIIEKLKPNNYEVEAYYLPCDDGSINEVYIYQQDEFIGKASKITKYNEATAEQTAIDREAYTNQAKYVSHFDKTIKERKKDFFKPGIIKVQEFEQIEQFAESVEVFENSLINEEEETIEDIIRGYDPEEYRQRSIKSI